MTQTQFIAALEAEYKKNVDISRAKNADYATGDDAFRNFRLISTLSSGSISVEQGILVRMTDKLQRVTNLLSRSPNSEKVVDEKITDTLSDLANYAMILKVYIDSKSTNYNYNQPAI